VPLSKPKILIISVILVVPARVFIIDTHQIPYPPEYPKVLLSGKDLLKVIHQKKLQKMLAGFPPMDLILETIQLVGNLNS